MGETAEVQGLLQQLMEWSGSPLVAVAPRRSGQRDERYAQLLGGTPAADAESSPLIAEPARLAVIAENDRISMLEEKVASLEDELAGLKAQFADFAKQFQ